MNSEFREISDLLKQGSEAAMRAKVFMQGAESPALRDHYANLAAALERKANEIDLRLAREVKLSAFDSLPDDYETG